MSDISIPGVNSKYGTQAMIDSLVKVEKNKLVQLEAQKKDYQDTRLIWQDTNKRMQSVRDAARGLYGFNNPFGSKIGTSSDDQSLTVAATRSATNGEYQVKVLQQAAADRFLSKSLPLDQTLPAGDYRFKVGEKELVFNFKGGKLQNFVDAINLKNPDLLRASLIRDTADTQILQLSAIPVGAKNALTVSGDALSQLTSLGVFGPAPGKGQDLAPGPATVAPGQKQVWTPANAGPLAAGLELQLTVALAPAPPAAAPAPAPFTYPAAGSVTFQGITIDGPAMAGSVPPAPAAQPPAEVKSLKGLVLNTGSASVALGDLPDSEAPVTLKLALPAGQNLQSIDLTNGNSARSVVVSSIAIHDTAQKPGPVPLHPLTRAQDAELEFQGIKIVRDKNAVDDVIPGVTLNLVSPSKAAVTVKVEPDKKAIKDSVIAFLGTYNQLLTDILVLTSIRTDPPSGSQVLQEATYLSDDEKKKAETRLGKFQGDLSLNQTKNTLQRIMMEAYPTDGSEYTLLAQVGISTNTTGGGDRVNASKLRGYMEMDEKTFDAALAKDIEGVKKLFGSSTDGTLVVNAGAAFRVDEALKPATQLGGFNAMKISTLDTQIKSKDKDISDYNDYLARYEADLKRKYGQMESSLNTMNKSAQSLNNLNTNNSGN